MIYLCAANPDFGKKQPYAYLAEVNIKKWKTKYALSNFTLKLIRYKYIKFEVVHKTFIASPWNCKLK